MKRVVGRLAKGARTPRQFAQLVPPSLLVVLGWGTLLLGWNRWALFLLSAGLVMFAGLLWFRVRKLSQLLRRAIRTHSLELAAVRRGTIENSSSRSAEDNLAQGGEIMNALARVRGLAALAAGLPIGIDQSYDWVADEPGEEVLLVADADVGSRIVRWARSISRASWVLAEGGSVAQRRTAGGLAAVVLVEGSWLTEAGSPIDRIFLAGLPIDATMVLAADDLEGFMADLQRVLTVNLAVVERGMGCARVAVIVDWEQND